MNASSTNATSTGGSSTRPDFTTPCPLGPAHTWVPDPGLSRPSIMRCRCACGAMGWRERMRMGRARVSVGPIRQYQSSSRRAHRAVESAERQKEREENPITARPRAAGNNETGGYLPPGA